MLGYLDAASGSIIVSAIVAGFAGVAVFLKILWRRVRHPLGSRRKQTLDEATGAGDTQVPTADQA